MVTCYTAECQEFAFEVTRFEVVTHRVWLPHSAWCEYGGEKVLWKQGKSEEWKTNVQKNDIEMTFGCWRNTLQKQTNFSSIIIIGKMFK